MQYVGGVIEAASAVVRGRDDVLDPYAEISRQVDPGLHGEAHPRHERLLLPLDHVGRFVSGDADAVTRAVDELLAVAGLGDHPTGGAVDLLARHPRPDRRDAGLLGQAHDLVHLPDLRARLTHAHRAAGVRAV